MASSTALGWGLVALAAALVAVGGAWLWESQDPAACPADGCDGAARATGTEMGYALFVGGFAVLACGSGLVAWGRRPA